MVSKATYMEDKMDFKVYMTEDGYKYLEVSYKIDSLNYILTIIAKPEVRRFVMPQKTKYTDLVKKLLMMFREQSYLYNNRCSLTWTDRDGDKVTNNTYFNICLAFCFSLSYYLKHYVNNQSDG